MQRKSEYLHIIQVLLYWLESQGTKNFLDNQKLILQQIKYYSFTYIESYIYDEWNTQW